MAIVNCKLEMRMRAMAAVATVVLLMMAVAVMARPAKLKDSTCSTSDEYVYPFWSFCEYPAQLSTGYVYRAVRLGLALAPEYDESNATYYVRLAESGSTYVAVTADSTDSSTLLVNSTVYIYNADSNRALAWRQEGTDEYFLIEQEVSSITEGAPFLFLLASSVLLPCPAIYPPAQCRAYYLVSYVGGTSSASGTSGAGLQSYTEDSVTYIKAAAEGSTGDLPLLITATTTSAIPFPTIRSVTARE